MCCYVSEIEDLELHQRSFSCAYRSTHVCTSTCKPQKGQLPGLPTANNAAFPGPLTTKLLMTRPRAMAAKISQHKILSHTLQTCMCIANAEKSMACMPAYSGFQQASSFQGNSTGPTQSNLMEKHPVKDGPKKGELHMMSTRFKSHVAGPSQALVP